MSPDRLRARSGARAPADDVRRGRRPRSAGRRLEGPRRAAGAASPRSTRASVAKATAPSGPRSTRSNAPASRPGTSTTCPGCSRAARSAPSCAATRRSSTRAQRSPSGCSPPRAEQASAHPRGVRRLLALTVPSPLGYVQRAPHRIREAAARDEPVPVDTRRCSTTRCSRCIDEPLAGRALRSRRPSSRRCAPRSRPGSSRRYSALVAQVAKVIERRARSPTAPSGRLNHLAFMSPLADARTQLGALVYPGLRPLGGRRPRCAGCPSTSPASATASTQLADNPGRDRRSGRPRSSRRRSSTSMPAAPCRSTPDAAAAPGRGALDAGGAARCRSSPSTWAPSGR